MFEYQRERRYSWLLLPHELEDLPNPIFNKQLDEIKTASDEFLINNVYTDVKRPTAPKVDKKVKTVSRRT
jgi:hypothetical protein